jgi:hypothetical protein
VFAATSSAVLATLTAANLTISALVGIKIESVDQFCIMWTAAIINKSTHSSVDQLMYLPLSYPLGNIEKDVS